ncbi:MAG: hypothetical protein ACTHXO_10480 [Actinomycetaceae bacterium]
MDLARVKRLITGDDRDLRVVLADLFPPAGHETPLEPALAWATAELDDAGLSADDQPLEAIRHLRSACPRLELRPAQFLVHHVTMRPAAG